MCVPEADIFCYSTGVTLATSTQATQKKAHGATQTHKAHCCQTRGENCRCHARCSQMRQHLICELPIYNNGTSTQHNVLWPHSHIAAHQTSSNTGSPCKCGNSKCRCCPWTTKEGCDARLASDNHACSPYAAVHVSMGAQSQLRCQPWRMCAA